MTPKKNTYRLGARPFTSVHTSGLGDGESRVLGPVQHVVRPVAFSKTLKRAFYGHGAFLPLHAARGAVDVSDRLPALAIGQSLLLQFEDDDPRSGFVDVEVLEL